MTLGKSTLAATAMGLAFSVTAANATTVDLGFILDESGSVGQANYVSSVNALKAALAQIPLATASVTYRVGVVSFSTNARTVATPVSFDTAADRQSVLTALTTEASHYNGGQTNYGAALNLLNSQFTSQFGTLGDTSIINMATDGQNNEGFTDDQVKGIAANLNTGGWDALSFEAVANTSQSDRNYLASIGFDSDGQGSCDKINDASGITSVTDNCFVLKVDSFAEFESAILKKVQKTVIDTGGDPDSQVPLPAGLPLILSGIGALGGLGALRRRKARS